MGKVIAIFIIGWLLFHTATRYQAEVGYYAGNQYHFWYGRKVSYEKCKEEAIGQYAAFNKDNSTRSTGWACLVWVGGNIVSKVR